MWRGLTQLRSHLVAYQSLLRSLQLRLDQQQLLQRETNLLLRELIVKVTTQPAMTPEAPRLPPPSTATPLPPQPVTAPEAVAAGQRPRILTERDIIRNTPSSIAQAQFEAEGRRRFPHREGEILPPPPRPLGGPP